ncbi:MAG: ribosome biogenesis GTPase Der [bacterium]|nr:ribosome biogenesis GTPase Der [bacterium]
MLNKQMSGYPIVAIVGKPNVGKSTFFNKLLGRRVSITSKIAGTTRDCIIAEVDWQGKTFMLIDTAGLDDVEKKDELAQNIYKQVSEAILDADIILFITDGADRIDKTDREIAEKLRKSRKIVLLVVNKAESPRVRERLPEYYSFGLGEPWPISAIHGTGVAEVLDKIADSIMSQSVFITSKREINHIPKIALIGRPNTGKSTLLNQITQSERAVVSEVPGTTRDSVSSKVTIGDDNFILIDTAGIRKRGRIERGVEKFSVLRTVRAIKESDLVVVLIDGIEGFVRGDVHLITQALEAGKPVILAINKVDVAAPDSINIDKFSFISKLPFVYISAKTGKSVDILVERIRSHFG